MARGKMTTKSIVRRGWTASTAASSVTTP